MSSAIDTATHIHNVAENESLSRERENHAAMRAKIESTILVAAAPDTRKRIGPTSNSMAVSAGGVFAQTIGNGNNRFAAGGRRPFVGAMPRRPDGHPNSPTFGHPNSPT